MLLEPGLSPPTDAMLTMRPPSPAASASAQRPAEQERAAQVRLQHAVPRGAVEQVELRERDADVPRRVVDEDVAAAEVAATTSAAAASIEDSSRWSRAIRWARRPCAVTAAAVRSAPSVLPTYVERDVAAGRRERLADRPADVARAARHERDLVRQFHRAERVLGERRCCRQDGSGPDELGGQLLALLERRRRRARGRCRRRRAPTAAGRAPASRWPRRSRAAGRGAPRSGARGSAAGRAGRCRSRWRWRTRRRARQATSRRGVVHTSPLPGAPNGVEHDGADRPGRRRARRRRCGPGRHATR